MATFPLGAGHGLMSCPAGAGLLPGLYAKPVALGGGHGIVGAGQSIAAKSMAANGTVGGAVKGAVAGGVACKGLSLGLGIGLGPLGPMVLAGLGMAAAYSLWRSRSAVAALGHGEEPAAPVAEAGGPVMAGARFRNRGEK